MITETAPPPLHPKKGDLTTLLEGKPAMSTFHTTAVVNNFRKSFLAYCHRLKKGPEVHSDLVGQQVWHLITGCHLCVGSSSTTENAEDLSHYDPGC